MNAQSEILRVDHQAGRVVVSGRFGLVGFKQDFGHCSRTADLFSQVTTSAMGAHGDEADNLSTVLNELLEWGFRCAADEGELQIQVTEQADSLSLNLTVPLPPESMTLFLDRAADFDQARARECFALELAKPMTEASPNLGLYWLASEYGQLQARQYPTGGLSLALELGG